MRLIASVLILVLLICVSGFTLDRSIRDVRVSPGPFDTTTLVIAAGDSLVKAVRSPQAGSSVYAVVATGTVEVGPPGRKITMVDSRRMALDVIVVSVSGASIGPPELLVLNSTTLRPIVPRMQFQVNPAAMTTDAVVRVPCDSSGVLSCMIIGSDDASSALLYVRLFSSGGAVLPEQLFPGQATLPTYEGCAVVGLQAIGGSSSFVAATYVGSLGTSADVCLLDLRTGLAVAPPDLLRCEDTSIFGKYFQAYAAAPSRPTSDEAVSCTLWASPTAAAGNTVLRCARWFGFLAAGAQPEVYFTDTPLSPAMRIAGVPIHMALSIDAVFAYLAYRDVATVAADYTVGRGPRQQEYLAVVPTAPSSTAVTPSILSFLGGAAALVTTPAVYANASSDASVIVIVSNGTGVVPLRWVAPTTISYAALLLSPPLPGPMSWAGRINASVTNGTGEAFFTTDLGFLVRVDLLAGRVTHALRMWSWTSGVCHPTLDASYLTIVDCRGQWNGFLSLARVARADLAVTATASTPGIAIGGAVARVAAGNLGSDKSRLLFPSMLRGASAGGSAALTSDYNLGRVTLDGPAITYTGVLTFSPGPNINAASSVGPRGLAAFMFCPSMPGGDGVLMTLLTAPGSGSVGLAAQRVSASTFAITAFNAPDIGTSLTTFGAAVGLAILAHEPSEKFIVSHYSLPAGGQGCGCTLSRCCCVAAGPLEWPWPVADCPAHCTLRSTRHPTVSLQFAIFVTFGSSVVVLSYDPRLGSVS